MNYKSSIVSILLSVIIINSIFIVPKGNKGLSLIFGKIRKNSNNSLIIYNSGINIKIPFIENIKFIDYRLQITKNICNNIITSDKFEVIINYYVIWNINNYNLYCKNINLNSNKIENIIKKIINFRIKKIINNKLSFKYLLNNTNNIIPNNINNLLKSDLIKIHNLGINITDVNISKIDIYKKYYKNIYKEIKKERNNLVNKYINEGINESKKIINKSNYLYNKKLKKANSFYLNKKGDTDSKILEMFSLFIKNDIEFYKFIKLIEIYKNIIKNNNIKLLININNLNKLK